MVKLSIIILIQREILVVNRQWIPLIMIIIMGKMILIHILVLLWMVPRWKITAKLLRRTRSHLIIILLMSSFHILRGPRWVMKLTILVISILLRGIIPRLSSCILFSPNCPTFHHPPFYLVSLWSIIYCIKILPCIDFIIFFTVLGVVDLTENYILSKHGFCHSLSSCTV